MLQKLLANWKLIAIIVLVAIGIIIWYQRTSAQKINQSITTSRVQKQDFVKTISSSGKIKADRYVELRFQTAGRLAWVGVNLGSTVKKGQAIASMDKREVQKNLEKALRDYSSERNDFEEAGRVTYHAQKPADALNDTVKRILEKNQWDLEKAVLDVELKHLALEYSTLFTPISGIVTQIDTPVAGVNITAAAATFAVADPSSLVFEASVDETDIANITLGQNATIILDATPESTYSGKISYVSYFSQQSASGATVFPVKVAFDNPQNLRIGLNGDISVETDRQEDVLTVPGESIREENGMKYVYKLVNGSYQKTEVTTGSKNENDVIITSGLGEDDQVVTKGFANIPK